MKTAALSVAALCAAAIASSAHAAEKTFVTDTLGISTALCESQRVIGGQKLPPLVGVNAAQKTLIPRVADYCRASTKLAAKELAVTASFDEAVINKKLEEAGSRLRIKFDKSGDPQFAVVSILKVSAEWPVPGIAAIKDKTTGTVTPVTVAGRPAFRMDLGKHAIRLLAGFRKGADPMIELSGKNGDKLLLWRSDDRPADEAAKDKVAFEIMRAASTLQSDDRYTGAVMPMASVDREVDISWVAGLRYDGTKWFVSQAKQQVRWDFDPEKAEVQTETALVNMSRTVHRGPYELDGSYYAVMMRPGMAVPYFSGFIGEEDLKAPKGWLDKQPK